MNSSNRLDRIIWPEQMDILCKENPFIASYYLKRISSIIQLKSVDKKVIPDLKNEIRLFAIMRNESLRLPHFINYYKNLGVDRFIIIDNNSSDLSVEIALSYDNVHVFATNDSYTNHWCWMQYLLSAYGRNRWCVVVDIDELFYFPSIEKLSIRQLCLFLEETNCTAFRSFLLDLYSETSINDVKYLVGEDPLNVLKYFDEHYDEIEFIFFDHHQWQPFKSISFTGGMRDRIFGKHAPPHLLSKISLFKHENGSYLAQGMHAINGSKVSDLQGAVLHTKFLNDFVSEVEEECAREEHYGKAVYYKSYKREINKNHDLMLQNNGSVQLIDSAQLVELGIMKTNKVFKDFFNL